MHNSGAVFPYAPYAVLRAKISFLYIRNEADILKFVDTLIANTKRDGKEGNPFWTKAETLLYCAPIAYIIFEGPAEDRNLNTLVDMIGGSPSL